MGDLNFRLDKIDKKEVEKQMAKRDFESVRQYDQVRCNDGKTCTVMMLSLSPAQSTLKVLVTTIDALGQWDISKGIK